MSSTQSGFSDVGDNSTAPSVVAAVAVDSSTFYYTTWWAAVSTFGLLNTLIGLLVMGIAGISPFIIVSLINSSTVAISWGMAWIAFNSLYSSSVKLRSVIIADIFWAIQLSSLSFYSFFIIRKIVKDRERIIYMSVFFVLEFVMIIMRAPIMVSRVVSARHTTPELERKIGLYITGYYLVIASCESWNAFFLLKIFYKAEKRRRELFASISSSGHSDDSEPHSSPPHQQQRNQNNQLQASFRFRKGFYSSLIRSSEIRLASICCLGIMRSITYTQTKDPGPAFDNFAACFESMFSTVFLVDILATRLAYYEQKYSGGSQLGQVQRLEIEVK